MDFNDTDVTTEGVINHDADEQVAKPMFLTRKQLRVIVEVLISVCVIVNVLLLVTVFSSRRLRRGATAGLVVTLTVSNILRVVNGQVTIPTVVLYNMEPVADVLCKAGSFFDAMLTTTSMFVLVAIAFDHYVAVCRPLNLQKRAGKPLTQGIIRAALCVLVATLLTWPEILIYRMIDKHHYTSTEIVDTNVTTSTSSLYNYYVTPNTNSAVQKRRVCRADPPAWLEWYCTYKVTTIFAIVVSYIVPMAIIFILYGYTAATLMNSGTQAGGCNQDKQRKDRAHTARSLIGLAFINLVVMLPMYVLLIIYEYKLVAIKHPLELAYVTLYLYVISCMINAIMVYVLSQKHRSQLIKILTCAICRQRFVPSDSGPHQNNKILHWMLRFWTSSKSSGADECDSPSTPNITTSSKHCTELQ